VVDTDGMDQVMGISILSLASLSNSFCLLSFTLLSSSPKNYCKLFIESYFATTIDESLWTFTLGDGSLGCSTLIETV